MMCSIRSGNFYFLSIHGCSLELYTPSREYKGDERKPELEIVLL